MSQQEDTATSANSTNRPRRTPAPIQTEAGEIELVPAYAYFEPAEDAWQRLQDLHHRALGEEGPFATEVANELSPEDAFSAYSHTSIALDAQLAASGLEDRDQLLHSLGDFVQSHGADGLEGVLLNTGWSAREAEGALDYTGQVLREAGLPDQLGGGAQTTFLLDAHDRQLGFADRGTLADRLGLGDGGGPSETGVTGGRPGETGVTTRSPDDQFAAGMHDLYTDGLRDPAFDKLAPGSDPTGIGGTSVDTAGVGGGDTGFDPTVHGEGSGLETDSGGADGTKTKGGETGGADGTKTKGGETGGADGTKTKGGGERPGEGGEGKRDDIFDKVERIAKTTAAVTIAGAGVGGGIGSLGGPPGAAGGAVIGGSIGFMVGLTYSIKREDHRARTGYYKDLESASSEDGAPYFLLPGPDNGCPDRPDDWPHPWADTFVAAGEGLDSFISVDDGRIALDNLPEIDAEGHLTDPGFLTADFFEAVGLPADDIVALYPDYYPETSERPVDPALGLIIVGAEEAGGLVENVNALKQAADALTEGLTTQDENQALSAEIAVHAAELSARVEAVDNLVVQARDQANLLAALEDDPESAAAAADVVAATQDAVRLVINGLEAWKLVAANQEPAAPQVVQELKDNTASIAAEMENLAQLLRHAPGELP